MQYRPPQKKKVMIIDDDDFIRNSFQIIINSSPKFTVVAHYSSCEEGLAKIRKYMPDIILMDVSLAGMSGIDGVKFIKGNFFHIEVIMVTVHEDSDLVFKALKAGASGYLSKSLSHVELLSGLEEIVKGGAPMSSRIARLVIEDFRIHASNTISEREREVLTMLASGKTYIQISEELAVSRETIKSHMRNIYKKLDVHKKSEAIEKGLKARWI